ncbi:uncharacterized protein J3R85_004493 [Psidium guajava]|nr:uncharacterized protein J3R85_004493 [Psidium guajava]
MGNGGGDNDPVVNKLWLGCLSNVVVIFRWVKLKGRQ